MFMFCLYSLLALLLFSYDGSVDYSVDIPLKSKLWEEVSWLRKAVQPLESPLVLCHNDLLLANVLYDESRGTVQLIDFEYAGPNYQAYDIANHFNEYASGETGCYESVSVHNSLIFFRCR